MDINLDVEHSVLKLHKIFVSKLDFTVNEKMMHKTEAGGGKPQCEFKYSILSDEPLFTVVITVHVVPENKAYEIKMDVTGIFTVDNEKKASDISTESLQTQNAIAIIFPFMRSYIANISHMGELNALSIPVFNIAAAISKAKNHS
jgi:preprotein translocase subunit SecB